MSHADKTPTEPAPAGGPPKACRGCSGLQPRPALVDVEDMGKAGLEKLIRKANIAQQMLTDIIRQLTKQQANRKRPQSKFLRRSNHRSNSFSFS